MRDPHFIITKYIYFDKNPMIDWLIRCLPGLHLSYNPVPELPMPLKFKRSNEQRQTSPALTNLLYSC